MVRFARNAWWVLPAVLVASIAGCSSSTAGQPSASDGGGTTTSEAPESAEPPKEEPNFANTDLCELLTPDEATTLGAAPPGEPGNSINDGHPQCTWTGDTSLVLGFDENGQSGEAPTGPEITNTEITVAGKPAVLSKKVTNVNTNCQVLVDVGETATVGILAGLHDSGAGKFEECDLATKFANVVLPKVLEKY